MDTRRTASIIEEEKNAQQYFQELKDLLRSASPRWWRKEFEFYVNRFINEKLREEEIASEEPEMDHVYLYGLWRLLAGAFQELELAQQPDHAATCAKIDGALVWQGRGYVSPILHAISSLQLSLQSKLEKVQPTFWHSIVV